ncbi:MAG: tRNA epoxyqueuosine(34) reductase QueG [Myxococcales bacterium]|nr:tRNA epoxyqueuosine(34) reductase QueG [Myxococcales bacterium]
MSAPFDEPLGDLRRRLERQAQQLGMHSFAVTDAKPATRLADYLRFVERGRHGEMRYLARPDRLERRRNLATILPDVQRLIVCTLPYWPNRYHEAEDSRTGTISRYAHCDDYHRAFGERLARLATTIETSGTHRAKWYCDTGPLMERDLAERAGLGFIGKNTLLIDPRRGSGLFLGVILTTAALPIDERGRMPNCGSCRRCLDACPTDAFPAPYELDARRCVSYLTIELKGDIPLALRPGVKHWLYGCDDCQTVCPWNRFAQAPTAPFKAEPPKSASVVDLLLLLSIDEAEFRRRFGKTPVARLGRRRLLRNAAVVLGNVGDRGALMPLQRLLRDRDPLLRDHAAWAISRIVRRLGRSDVSTRP